MEIQKAFKLSVKDMVADEPWHYDDIIVYAETHGEAKNKGMMEFDGVHVQDYSQINYYKGDFLRDVTFLDIRARRVKKLDKIFYRDLWRTREDISQLEWMDKRDEEAKQLWVENPDGIAVIWAGCYNSYWGENRCGYFSELEYAGKYTTKEAYEIVKGNDYSRQEKVILLDKEKYNKELQEKANRLLKSMV